MESPTIPSRAELSKLMEDLPFDLPETLDSIYEKIVERKGMLGAACHYSTTPESYNYHRLAGRLAYLDLLRKLGGSHISSYVERVKHVLRPEIITYLTDNADFFQDLLFEADKWVLETFDWFMFMSHETTYLLRDGYEGKIIETVSQMTYRVVAELFYNQSKDQLSQAIICYQMLYRQLFTFASPVLFNAGQKKPNLSSCFLIPLADSLPGIYGPMYQGALVSQAKGGIGFNVNPIRHSYIGHDGMSRGLIPLLQLFDRSVRYVDQTGKRNGAATAFAQAQHNDIMDFARCNRKNADPENRVDNLNTAIMFPDLFWERVKEDGDWTLFDSAIFKGLGESFGDDFRELYLKYETKELSERDKPFRVKIEARALLDNMIDTQILTGMPYVLHKDSINACSNQVNMASHNPMHKRVIQSGNLCLEIFEQTDSEEVACCNLGQMSFKAFVKDRKFDFNLFATSVRHAVKFLDRVIDQNHYVFTETKTSNMRHRPIGLGVSGYADMLELMKIPYDSEEASKLNVKIFACMYYNAIVSSLELAIDNGAYSTFVGSPLSEGKFAFDLWRDRMTKLRQRMEIDEEEPRPVDPTEWGQQPIMLNLGSENHILKPSWDLLRKLVMKYGVRNSQIVALMPSASTSRIMGNAENTEAHQANIYLRNFMKASAVVINPRLFQELSELRLWSRDVSEFIVSEGGSVARLPEFLLKTSDGDREITRVQNLNSEIEILCSRYKTMFELKQLKIFKQIADRHRYVCQGISANLYLPKPTREMLRNFHIFTHSLGLKTGMYYLRQPPPAAAPKYARTSTKVSKFLTGPPMPLITVHHEPFPDHGKDLMMDDVVIQIEDDYDKEHEKFTMLLERGEIEIVTAAREPQVPEEEFVCRRESGCVGCS
jgi:ribonucleoside-diphosphate reductase alpha chain